MNASFRFGFVVLCSVVTVTTVDADYLEVRRSANLRELATSSSARLEKLEKGMLLELLSNGVQTNGYYKVKSPTIGGTEGWVYRTLVRRHRGQMPHGDGGSTSVSINTAPPSDYYTPTVGLSGDSLKKQLHVIIKEHREFSYDAAWDILKELDVDPQNPNNVIGIYSGFSMNAAAEYDASKGWNREHVWAKSFGDFGTRMGAGTDLHHLRAADVSTNSARNNRTFDESDIPYIDESGNYKGATLSFSDDDWTWEPRADVKGDVARMIFYMVVRYEGGDDDEPDLELTEAIKARDNKKPTHGKRSVILEWHQDDPVDDHERRRNSLIYEKYQRNRNPFIDHPEFVSRIWTN